MCVIVAMLYLAIGLVGRRVFGYNGLLEILLWPIAIPCAVILKGMEDDEQ